MKEPAIFGILGNPVQKSLSPLIHNFLFEKYKIKARYYLFEIPEDQLPDAIEGVRVLGIKGVNVTAPFKEKVVSYLDEIKREAQEIGAVNTIHNKNGRLMGYNTDIYGIKKILEDKLKFSAEGKQIAILGAGGAAKACAFTLLGYNPKEISIINRNLKKAKLLSRRFSNWSKNTNIAVHSLEDLERILNTKKISLVINATSGDNFMIRNALTSFLKKSQKETKMFDLKYHLSRQNKVLSNNSDFIDGTYMLVAQALESFYIWTKIRPDFNVVLNLVSDHIKKEKYA